MAKARARKSGRTKRRPGGEEDASARAVAAALDLIAERGWRSLTLDAVAERAGLDLGAVRTLFPQRGALLEAFFREVDRHVAAEGSYSADDPNPARDRLFDVLMRRFDALQPHRAAIGALVRDLPFDPPAAAASGRRICRALKGTLETAGLSPQGPLGCLRLQGLGAIYLYALRVWLTDETSDLSPTMAALDKGLRAAESAMAVLRSLARGKDPGRSERPERKKPSSTAARGA